MQFSKLRLLGFKSFVDPVELDILSGLTGIVGPNGCGKSNLLEALRWVMGENRPSSMRSGGMEDVIFAGAGTRAAKNFAEVLVGLDDVDQGLMGVDNYRGSVEVIRRVTRDVGSSYRLNGKDVRAKDVSMFFADSSTGAHSPSLVQQGQISELINSNPKSRRSLLEEAAGISGLYQRRHEAELKLKSSESNLLRLQDVIEQIETQIKALDKQAKQALKYERLAEDIRKHEAYLFCKKWFVSDSKVLTQIKSLAEKTKLSVAAELELLALSKKREEIEQILPNLRNEETSASAALQRLIVEKVAIENEEKRAENTISELADRVEETRKDYSRQKNLINDALEVIERINWESDQLTKLLVGQDEFLKQVETESSDSTIKLVEEEHKLDKESKDFASLLARSENLEKQLFKTKSDLKQNIEEGNDARKQKTLLAIEFSQKQNELEKTALSFQKSKEEARSAEESLQALEKSRIQAVAEELTQRLEFSKQEGILAALKSEQNALKGMFSPDFSGSNQIIDELVISKGYEQAVGVAFSDDIKAPVIFKNDKSGWFQLQNSEESFKLPEGVECLSLHVNGPSVLKRRLSNIGVVDKTDGPELQKLLKVGQKLVSLDGSLWRWDGYCYIGSKNVSETAVRLKQKNRLLDLRIEIARMEKKLEISTNDLTVAQNEAECRKNDESLARETRIKSDEYLSEASRRVSRVESELSILSSKTQSLEENFLLRDKDKERLEVEILELSQTLTSLDSLDRKKNLLENQRLLVEKARDFMVEKRTLFDQTKRDKDSRKKRLEELQVDLKNWELRLATATDNAVELEKRKKVADHELKEAILQPKSLLSRRETVIKLVGVAEKKKAKCSDNVSKKESELKVSSNEEKDCASKVAGLREDLARTTALKESAEQNLSELRKLIIERTSCDPSELMESLTISVDELPEESNIESELFSLKNSRDSLGAVNLRAAEDSKGLTKEWETILAEKTELETAIKKLRSAIISLNSEGRARLLSAFKDVNKNFCELFGNLFGGGSAKLTFIESEDPLDAGLEIICQPPGKKLATLSLLSGGEQTLTALALIFAVFKANPSPICVLDEVDAPLDDANVERFCGLLNKMTQKTDTRFMIITHHPITMSRMDRLYGVTMVERGVSQLVSVDLKRAEQLLDV